MLISIIQENRIPARLQAFTSAGQRASLVRAGAKSASALVQANFLALASERHRKAAPQNFFAEAARNTRAEVDGSLALVRIHKEGVALRYFGGTVVPVNVKALSIPARDEAIGKRPREFNNLHYVFFKSLGIGALVENESTDIVWAQRGRQNKTRHAEAAHERGGLVFFWLVKSTTHQPDPTILPHPDDMIRAVRIGAINQWNALLGAKS